MSSQVAANLTVPNPITTSTLTPASGSQGAGTLEGLDHWLKDFQKYDSILAEMAKAAADKKFGDELTTIDQWFKVLSEPERTASVYTFLQHSTQEQMKFFMAVIQQQMMKIEVEDRNTGVLGLDTKPKSRIGLRPPSLNIPMPDTPTPTTPTTSKVMPDSAISTAGESNRLGSLNTASRLSTQTPLSPSDTLKTPASESNNKSWASMVNTPLVPMFQKPDNNTGMQSDASKGQGVGAINTSTLNMLASSGLSSEAQMLAVQLVMTGILKPGDIGNATAPSQSSLPSPASATKNNKKHNWRTPASAKYPGSALRSGLKSSGLKSSGLRSAALKSSGLDSASMESPRVEDFNPELLKDIPAWLRSLRLHKYTNSFDGMTWQEIVVMDDVALEKKGVAALGARRRLLRTFEHVRKEMGLEDLSSATPTTSLITSNASESGDKNPLPMIPQSASVVPKLSVDSPVFVPTGLKVPNSAAPVLITPSA